MALLIKPIFKLTMAIVTIACLNTLWPDSSPTAPNSQQRLPQTSAESTTTTRDPVAITKNSSSYTQANQPSVNTINQQLDKALQAYWQKNLSISQLRQQVSETAANDIAAVYDWAAVYLNTPALSHILFDVVALAISQDLNLAARLLLEQQQHPAFLTMAETYARTAAQQDTEQALLWMASSLNYETQKVITRVIYAEWLTQAPYDALAALDYSATVDPDSRREIAKDAAQYLAPETLAHRLQNYSDDIQNTLAYGLMQHWLPSDKPAAIEWLLQLEAGPVKDKAIAAYFHYSTPENTVIANNIANLASNDTLRQHYKNEYNYF